MSDFQVEVGPFYVTRNGMKVEFYKIVVDGNKSYALGGMYNSHFGMWHPATWKLNGHAYHRRWDIDPSYQRTHPNEDDFDIVGEWKEAYAQEAWSPSRRIGD